MLSGCIIEEDIDYHGNDIKPHGYRKIMESQQACADFCKTIMGGKFWSWSSGDNLCYVKSLILMWPLKLPFEHQKIWIWLWKVLKSFFKAHFIWDKEMLRKINRVVYLTERASFCFIVANQYSKAVGGGCQSLFI